MSGPLPAYRPDFPPDFLRLAGQTTRRRTVRFQLRQRASLVLLLQDHPALSHVEAGRHVGLHPDQVRRWRRRWAASHFSLEDQPGRGTKPRFSPLGRSCRQSPRL
jgi:transposase-like protein